MSYSLVSISFVLGRTLASFDKFFGGVEDARFDIPFIEGSPKLGNRGLVTF